MIKKVLTKANFISHSSLMHTPRLNSETWVPFQCDIVVFILPHSIIQWAMLKVESISKWHSTSELNQNLEAKLIFIPCWNISNPIDLVTPPCSNELSEVLIIWKTYYYFPWDIGIRVIFKNPEKENEHLERVGIVPAWFHHGHLSDPVLLQRTG